MEFEEFHLSEVQNMASEEKLEQVLTSMKTNKVAMKGTLLFSALHLPSCLKSINQLYSHWVSISFL